MAHRRGKRARTRVGQAFYRVLEASPYPNPSRLAAALGIAQPSVWAWMYGGRPSYQNAQRTEQLIGFPMAAWEWSSAELRAWVAKSARRAA